MDKIITLHILINIKTTIDRQLDGRNRLIYAQCFLQGHPHEVDVTSPPIELAQREPHKGYHGWTT